MTPIEMGVIILAPAAGRPMERISRQHQRVSSRSGQWLESIFSLNFRTSREATSVVARAMTVAQAAPISPISGMNAQPNISSGSSRILNPAEKTMIRLGVPVSPAARMALFPIMGMTKNTIPKYQICMYCLMKGSTSGFAPNALNSGSMVSSPMVASTATMATPSVRLLVVNRCTRERSP